MVIYWQRCGWCDAVLMGVGAARIVLDPIWILTDSLVPSIFMFDVGNGDCCIEVIMVALLYRDGWL